MINSPELVVHATNTSTANNTHYQTTHNTYTSRVIECSKLPCNFCLKLWKTFVHQTQIKPSMPVYSHGCMAHKPLDWTSEKNRSSIWKCQGSWLYQILLKTVEVVWATSLDGRTEQEKSNSSIPLPCCKEAFLKGPTKLLITLVAQLPWKMYTDQRDNRQITCNKSN